MQGERFKENKPCYNRLGLYIPPVALQVVGHKKGLYVMERADPLFLLMGLPTIPVVLVLGKMIRWEDYIVRMWQKYSYKRQLPPGKHTHVISIFVFGQLEVRS